MPTKAYFIGLGGCGLKTVADLQQRLCPTGDFSEYKFTYVDTDDSTVSKINAKKEIIRSGDLVNVGDTNPFQVYQNAEGGRSPREKRFMEWVIAQDNADPSRARFTLPNNYLADGARGQRMIGRTAVYHRYDDIYRELAGKIDTFFEHDSYNASNQIPQVWVVASSCGGTGSSMTLDVLYILDKIVNSKCPSSPELKLVLFMPKPFMDANSGNIDYPLNAYSYMWELNAFRLDFQRNIFDRFHNFSVDKGAPTNRVFPLYKFIIPVDVETSFGTKIPLDSLYPTVAELIYYCNKGTAAQEMMSSISNDQNQLTEVTENDRTPFKWTRTLVPYGYRVIKKANEEFRKYMSVRALYEVLKYGVLGEQMPDDPKLRDQAKKAFANEYILKYLCDVPELGFSASDASLQADVAEVFAEVRISPSNLDKQRINYALNSIDELSYQVNELSLAALKRIESAIDKGVQKVILEHGLKYAKELLNNIDDFYLESDVLPLLKVELAKTMEAQAAKRSECAAICAEFKEKQAPAAAKALNEYRDLTQRYQVLQLAVSLIDEGITSHPSGYLEVVRKGDAVRNGLQNVITKVEDAATKAYDQYVSLAKAFIETSKDALTEYLPNLDSIAKGENDTYWAKDSIFDMMYHESIIGYDAEHELATRQRVPVRKNTGDNNLAAFVECVCAGETSLLNLALDKDRLRFDRNFFEWILGPLKDKIEQAMNKEGTVASRWLRYTLEESLDVDNMLPKDITRERFLNSMANRDRIPVLYPMTAGATRPTQVRVMYAGASESLAMSLGYNPQDNAGNKFVQDDAMDDRFLIIKMPLGLDFYSYKYFLEIQNEYIQNRKGIVGEVYGCHMHKEFSSLDLNKAEAKVQQKALLSYVRPLYSATFMQCFLDILKRDHKPLYDRLWGNLGFGWLTDGTALVDDDPFGLGNVNVDDDPFASLQVDLLDDSDQNRFLIKFAINQAVETFTITTNKFIKGDGSLSVYGQPVDVELTDIKSFSAFLNNISAVDTMDSIKDLSASVGVLKAFIAEDAQLKQVYNAVIPQVSKAMQATSLLKIAMKWRQSQNPGDIPYFTIIQEILRGRV